MAEKKSSELKDLDVERVDGVDKPATGRHFLLFKSENGDAIMKGYAMVATAADNVLKAIRKDEHAVLSRKSAVMLNGLAQVLGQGAVFVGKSVPTQPYVFSEPDADKRGPADEDLGPNFTPRSMPGSMVGKVEFRMKDEEEEEEDAKRKRGPKMYDEDEEEEDAKRKRKRAKADDDDDDDDDVADEGKRKRKRGYDEDEDDAKGKRKQKRMKDEDEDEDEDEDDAKAKSIASAVAAAVKSEIRKITKAVDEDLEPVRKSVPRSRQVDQDDEQPVRKSEGGYTPKFGVSFADVCFGKR